MPSGFLRLPDFGDSLTRLAARVRYGGTSCKSPFRNKGYPLLPFRDRRPASPEVTHPTGYNELLST